MKRYLILIILVFSTILVAEEFSIEEFSNPAKYNWNNMKERFEAREDLDQRQKLLQIYQMNKQKVVGNMLKSAIVPGWGHYLSKDYTRGHVFLASEVILIGSSIYFYSQAMDDYSTYEDSHYIGDIKQFYLDANSNYKYSQIFLSLGAIIWLYSIYDSVSATHDYNQKYWNELTSKMQSQKVVITPTSITVRF